MSPQAQPERSIGELFAVLGRQTSTLIQQEMQLATAEFTAKATAFARSSTLLLVGLALLALGGAALVGAIIAALTAVLPLWASALIVGAFLAAAGGTIVMTGLAGIRAIQPLPTATLRTLRDDLMWVKGELQ
ncbi:MAG: phage holin family protein [Myxococcales bacterium]|nr:phage holin family protein [Myxococcales bacterium]